MEKEKITACKQHLQKAAHWDKAQLTPQRLKKGAGFLLALAILAGGGKIVLHQQKAQAHAQEARARTEMLQNLAAQKNIQLVSTDQVKETIASTLGTDPASITFQSVTLDDRKPGQPSKDHKDFQKDRKDKKEKGQKKDGRKYRENARRQGQPESPEGQTLRDEFPGAQQDQPPVMPGNQDEGNGSQNQYPDQGIQPRKAPQSQMVKTARADAFHGIYIARCEKDGMRYNFLVDAQSGQVLRGQVHKMNPIQRLFS
ncbi:hypothetical protein [Acidaminococcus sp.]|uniref:hypothetical protein n=1 Tax=Acidaminococcus sp. TaxID=1872103 RepID=UPI003D7CA3E6